MSTSAHVTGPAAVFGERLADRAPSLVVIGDRVEVLPPGPAVAPFRPRVPEHQRRVRDDRWVPVERLESEGDGTRRHTESEVHERVGLGVAQPCERLITSSLSGAMPWRPVISRPSAGAASSKHSA